MGRKSRESTPCDVEALAEAFEKVLGLTAEHDVLPIVMVALRDNHLITFINAVPAVCKLWHRGFWITDSCVSRLKSAHRRYQQLYTPTFAGGLELAYGMLIDELWISDPMEYIRDLNPLSPSSFGRVMRQVLSYGGWELREARRFLTGLRVRVGALTWTVRPSAVLKKPMGVLGVPHALLPDMLWTNAGPEPAGTTQAAKNKRWAGWDMAIEQLKKGHVAVVRGGTVAHPSNPCHYALLEPYPNPDGDMPVLARIPPELRSRLKYEWTDASTRMLTENRAIPPHDVGWEPLHC
jgi:hypothetical protein